MAKSKRPTLRPVLDHIIFIFQDELITAQGVKQFRETTKWGFELTNNYDHNIKQPRWGIVIAVGPDVKEPTIEPGARIFIDALKWTEGVKFEDNLYWMTKEEHIIGIDDETE